MSDIGILNSPADLAIIVIILGWPVLLAGAVIGAAGGWWVGRGRRLWIGLLAGVVVGTAVGAIVFVEFADRWID